MVDRAVKHRPDRPVVVMTEAPPNGFLRQAFEAGADDVITLPQASEEVAFTLQKVIARRRGLVGPGEAHGAAHRGSRAQGRNRQDALRDEPRGRARPAGRERRPRRPRPAVRGHRPGSRALSRADDVRPDEGRPAVRPRQARPAPDSPLFRRQGADRADAAGPGERRLDRLPPRHLRLAAVDVRLRDRRHAAGLHSRGDRDDRRLDRDLHGRDARLALAQEHEARASRRSTSWATTPSRSR